MTGMLVISMVIFDALSSNSINSYSLQKPTILDLPNINIDLYSTVQPVLNPLDPD